MGNRSAITSEVAGNRQSGDQSIAVDSKGLIARVGIGAARHFGQSAENLVSVPLDQLVQFRHQESNELICNFLAQTTFQDLAAERTDVDICFPTGERFPLRQESIDGTGGERLAILTLTSRQSNLVSFSEEIDLLTQTAQMAQVGGWDLERSTGRIRWTAQTFRIHELEPGNPPDIQTALGFYAPDDRQILTEAIERALAYGEPYDLELKLRTAKGNTRYTRSICQPVFADGEIVRLQGTFQDISDRRQAEQELLESETRYRDIFENNNAIKLVIDPATTRIVEANSAAMRFYGYSADEMSRMSISDLNIADEETLGDALCQAHNDQLQEFEFQHRLSSGEIRDVKVHTGTIRIKQKTFVHSIIFDITERKRAQEAVTQMQQLESLGTLAGGIAHDFNNVMTAVFGNILCVKEMLHPSHPTYSFLHGAENAVERARALSQKLLTFAKGGVPICESVSLAELVTEVVKFDLSGSNVRAEFCFDEGLQDVHVDRAQLQQVFSNLSMNADQAMPDGGVLKIHAKNLTVAADQYPELKAGEYVRVTVEDDGVGIRRKDLNRIFDPYFSTKATGHGLGLATCYSIIKKNGGRIEAQSQFGKRTQFSVFLPAATQQKNVSPGIPENESSELVTGVRILLLDDEQIILDVVATILERHGAIVAKCVSTTEAIRLYIDSMNTQAKFDIVILDLTIPGEHGGKDAVRKLRSIDPDVRAICSSGYADDPVIARYADYGFQGALAKPYKTKELRQVINSVLEADSAT